jgi:hypothetical protein
MKPEVIIFIESCRYAALLLRQLLTGEYKRINTMRKAQAKIDSRNLARKQAVQAFDLWAGTSADYDISTRG